MYFTVLETCHSRHKGTRDSRFSARKRGILGTSRHQSRELVDLFLRVVGRYMGLCPMNSFQRGEGNKLRFSWVTVVNLACNAHWYKLEAALTCAASPAVTSRCDNNSALTHPSSPNTSTSVWFCSVKGFQDFWGRTFVLQSPGTFVAQKKAEQRTYHTELHDG